MKCCMNCFADSEIKSIIKTDKKKGTCDICNSSDTYIYDTENSIYLAEYLFDIVDIYSHKGDLPLSYPDEYLGSLADKLFNDWNIFAIEPSEIIHLVEGILSKTEGVNKRLFTEEVGIRELDDPIYLKENSLINGQWGDFVESIKYVNRFHNDHINFGKLKEFCEDICEEKPTGEILFRARISDEKGYPPKKMGAPPVEKIREGRANSSGITCLYLTDNIDTAIREVRAGAYDYVTVGRFKLNESLNIVDLTQIYEISPFVAGNYLSYAINRNFLKDINDDIAKPLRRKDLALDYLPTQYISDYVKSLGYDGIKYKSTLSEAGNNYAIFNDKKCKCTYKKIFYIDNLDFHKKVL